MEQLRSRLEAMRIQELHYQCSDYTSEFISTQRPRPELEGVTAASPSRGNPGMVHLLLDECASLVTDPLTRMSSVVDERKIQAKKNDLSPVSPSSVINDTEPDSCANEQCGSKSSLSQECVHSATSTTRESPFSPGAIANSEALTEDAFILSNPGMAQWRLEMFDWACMVVDQSQMDRSAVLATAFNILDRYTTFEIKRPHSAPVSREDYQLFAMTALYIAVKVLEPYPQKMSLNTFSLMSCEFYLPQDIASTELQILEALQWKTTPPTTIGFCRELMLVLMPRAEECAVDMEQIYPTICDVSVSDPSFLNFSNSVIAVAALLHSARLTGRSRREQNRLRRKAEEALDLGRNDKSELVALEIAYKKIEQLCS